MVPPGQHPIERLVGPPGNAPVARVLGRGEGWRVSEVVCRLGPQDRQYQERHDEVVIAAVVEGSFQYRSADGDALFCPGSFLLGNAGAAFQCGHDHGTGDRCIAFHFAPSLFAELAATMTGSARFRFPTAMLPPSRKLALPTLQAELAASGDSAPAMEELALRLVETVLGMLADIRERGAGVQAKAERRISNALRYIEENAERPLGLAGIAAAAGMSKYHFLRAFRSTLGATPYQYLLGLRMRRAAIRLRTTALPVTTVAFDAGFPDLSTFSRQFRDAFGTSPGRFRHGREGWGIASRSGAK